METDLLGRISTFVTQKIAPGVLSHGGYIEIVEFNGGNLKLGLSGACSTCSLEGMSAEGISNFILEEFPELNDCEVVDMPPESPVAPLAEQITKS